MNFLRVQTQFLIPGWNCLPLHHQFFITSQQPLINAYPCPFPFPGAHLSQGNTLGIGSPRQEIPMYIFEIKTTALRCSRHAFSKKCRDQRICSIRTAPNIQKGCWWLIYSSLCCESKWIVLPFEEDIAIETLHFASLWGWGNWFLIFNWTLPLGKFL